jgi:hypothetical protein
MQSLFISILEAVGEFFTYLIMAPPGRVNISPIALQFLATAPIFLFQQHRPEAEVLRFLNLI